jgi:hypothetical protein
MVIQINSIQKLFSATKADLVQTHTEVENVRKELNELKGNFKIFKIYKRIITENLNQPHSLFREFAI